MILWFKTFISFANTRFNWVSLYGNFCPLCMFLNARFSTISPLIALHISFIANFDIPTIRRFDILTSHILFCQHSLAFCTGKSFKTSDLSSNSLQIAVIGLIYRVLNFFVI
jgi:hypothetical protein